MALIEGTNCGFVTVAPSVDPDGEGTGQIDNLSAGFRVVAPVGATAITEIGWYCPAASEAANFQVGLYSHDAVNDEPEARLVVSADTAKGTEAGWKLASVSLAITVGTTYWICVQCDDTATVTTIDRTNTAGERQVYKTSEGASENLIDPWGASDGSSERLLAIYVVYTTAGGGIDTAKKRMSATHLLVPSYPMAILPD